MFGDIGWAELMIIAVVALIVIGPKDLPEMFRQLGRVTAKIRAMARDFSRAMEQAAKDSGVSDVAKDMRTATSPKAMGLDKVRAAADKFEKWDPLKPVKPAVKPLTPPPIPPVTPVAAAVAVPEPAAAPAPAATAPAAQTEPAAAKPASKPRVARTKVAVAETPDGAKTPSEPGEETAAKTSAKTPAKTPRKKAEPK